MGFQSHSSSLRAPGAQGWFVMLVLLATLFAAIPDAHAARAFARRFPAAAAGPLSVTGDITLIGNTSLVCANYTSNAACINALSGADPTARNNSFVMTAVNIDPDGINSNSSYATLAMPAGSTVLFAGLYWAGSGATTPATQATVRLKRPGAGYASVTATATDVIGAAYQSFADVTASVQAGGNGIYTVGNVGLTAGAGNWAGWTLVVAYSNPTSTLRNLSVFDGFQAGDSSNPQIDIGISGFYTPTSGIVNTNIGVVVYDGDRGQSDSASGAASMSFGATTGSLSPVSDAINPVSDFWNSSVSFQGANVAIGRNPAALNTLGIDIDNVRPNVQLPNGSSTAVLRTTANDNDVNYPGVITLATDVFQPVISSNFNKTATDGNGPPFRPGDDVTYTISVSNTGNDTGIKNVITDPLPANVTYVPGSLEIVSGPNAGAKTDAGGDDQADFNAGTNTVTFRVGTGADASQGGSLAPVPAVDSATSVRFHVTIKPTLADGASVSNVATINFVGQATGLPGSGTNPPTSFTVSRNADLSISKTGPASVNASGSVTYVVTVANAGPNGADGATVTDNVPAGLGGVAISCVGAGGAVCPATAGLATLSALAIPTLPGSGSVTFTITGTAPASGSLSNSASVAAPAGTVDPTPANNSAGPVVTTINASADVSVVKTLLTSGPYLVGQTVGYSIVVSNAGPATATAVDIADTPNNLTITGVSGACASLPCTIASLASGASATIFANATIDADGAFSNSATATGSQVDPSVPNNTDTVTAATTPTANLGITKTLLNPGAIRTGDTVAYQIVVTNAGPSAVADALVTDTMPPQLGGVSWTCAPAANCGFPSGSGDISMSVSLASGDSATITVTGTAPTTTPSTVGANTASVAAPAGVTDPVPLDNIGTVAAIPVTAFAIAANDDPIPAPVNGSTGGVGIGNVLGNDTYNGAPIDPAAIILAPVSNGPLTVNANGSVDVAASTPAGTYSVVYQICEATNPGNCDSATVAVTVAAAVIDAVDDTVATPVVGRTGGTNVTNVLVNDTLNGAPVNPSEVTAAPASSGPLTVNANGSVDVAPGTPVGSYSVAYQVCQNLNPANCDTATVTITVSAATIDAVDDVVPTAISGGAGATDVVNVLGNDTLGGSAVSASAVTVAAATSGPLAVKADGNVDVAANTPAGTYSVGYTLCETLNPANCDTATVTVTVSAALVDAVDDTIATPVNGASGAANVGNVLVNDQIDGSVLNPAAITLVPVTVGPLAIAADGGIAVAAGTPAGIYSANYTICEQLNPANCDSATVTVTVSAATIDAVDDVVGTPVNGADGGSNLANVLGNDTRNGATATTATVTLTPVTSGPLSVNADGSVDLAAATAAGTYSATYTICEILNPANCDTATVTITVSAAPIDAVDDVVGTPVNGANGATNVANVLGNDTLNGAAAATPAVTLAPATSGPLTINANGSVDVAPATAAGTYTVNYTICEQLNPTNCDTASVTVTVSAALIDAVDDSVATVVNGASGGTDVANVLGNDRLNGAAATTATISLVPVATGPITVNANGSVDVAAGTAAGTYTASYTICEQLNPSNCDTATVTVGISAAPINAVDDVVATAVNGASGGTNVANVLGNDTLNGGAASTATITLAPVSSGPLVINANGSVDVAAGTAAGTYSATYTICEQLNPTNCDTATLTVTVSAAPIDAVDDVVATAVNGASGGSNVVNVLGNDTLNGAAANTATIVLAPVSSGPLTISATGRVDVAANTAAATYTATYTICEQLNPTNCDTATVTVTVSAAPIDAVDDIAPAPVNGVAGGTAVANVLANDTLDGAAMDPASVTLAPVSSGPLTVNANGSVVVAANTPSGTYTVVYQVCENLNPTNCDTATVTVVVSAAAITASDDTAATPQNTPVTSIVLANDALNGGAVVASAVAVTIASAPANGVAKVGSDGRITYTPAANFSGSDSDTYTICEKLNPANCATATVRITVQPNVVTAVDDVATTDQQVAVSIAVLANDHTTGAPLDPAAVTVVAQPANGTVSCAAGACTYTPREFYAGVDHFTYRACDVSRPTPVCATATVTITVVANAAVLRLAKQSQQRTVNAGDLVRYTITIDNVGDAPAINASLVDTPPAGFSYVDGSLVVDDDNHAGTLGGTMPLRIDGLDVAIGGHATVVYYLRVGAGVGHGVFTNRVASFDTSGRAISNSASADVEIAGDPLFDDSLVVGSVFDDRNGNGVQDVGERGLPGVRVVSVDGLVMETDGYGRYHLEGVSPDDMARGRNFILKVDPATLPAGTVFTTENPRVRRITPGLPVRFDFGVRLPPDPSDTGAPQAGGGEGER